MITAFFVGLGVGLLDGPFAWVGIKYGYRKLKEKLA